MKTFGFLTCAASLVLVLTAQAGDDAAQKKDKAALQGMWKVISLENAQGKDAGAEGAMIEFDKDGKTMTYTQQGNTKKGTYTLNPAANPKEIDIKAIDENKTFEAIYKVEKDSLKLCLAAEPGDGRPSEFATKEGKSYVLVTMERAK